MGEFKSRNSLVDRQAVGLDSGGGELAIDSKGRMALRVESRMMSRFPLIKRGTVQMGKFRVGFKSLLQFGKKCRKELTEQV